MAKRMKAYLRRWILWIVLPMLGSVWAVVTYLTFWTADGRQDLGLVGWIVITVMIVLAGVMLWLMASGRLPTYILEMEIEDDDAP